MRFAFLRVASVRSRLGEVRLGEVRPEEVRLPEVRPPEVRPDVGVLATPLVPGGHALLEQCDVLVVGHRTILVLIPILAGKYSESFATLAARTDEPRLTGEQQERAVLGTRSGRPDDPGWKN